MQIYKKMYLPVRVSGADLRKVFLLFCLLSLQLSLSAQKRLSFNFNNITVEQAFKEIEIESGYTFAYNKSKYSFDKTVSLSMKDAALNDILKNVLKGTGYDYSISNKRIFLSVAKEEPKPVKQTTETSEPVEVKEEKDITENDSNLFFGENVAERTVMELEKLEPDTTRRYVTIPQNIMAEGTREKFPDWTTLTPVIGSPVLAIKSNLLYDLTTTFNLGLEVALTKRYTLDLSVNYNPWTFGDNKKIKHLMFQPEVRYWLCESFKGHFFGLHAQYTRFNVGGVGFSDYMKDHRFQGNLFGAGFSYGYQWFLFPRWSMEATIGFGYNYLDYKTYECKDCGKYQGENTKHYFGPTKAGISLIYMLK